MNAAEPSGESAWGATIAALAAGEPALGCELPAIAAEPAARIVGDFEVRGWAVAPGGLEDVRAEIEGRGSFTAQIGLRRADVRTILPAASYARRPGFELRVPTSGWLPGSYGIRITATDAAGSIAALDGRVVWQPDVSSLAADIESGRPGLWVGEPTNDARDPLGEWISVRGWVASRTRIETVVVDVEGLAAVSAFFGTPVPAADASLAMDTPPAMAFAAVLDARGLDPVPRAVSVTATDVAGASATRAGTVVIDAVERYRLRLERREPRAAPRRRGAALQVCVTDGKPSEALLGSLRDQVLGPQSVEPVSASGLEGRLRALVDDPAARGLVLVAARDRLAPAALASASAALDAGADLVYADHDTLDSGGRRAHPFLKPGWSPELLLALDYVGSFVVVGRGAAEAALRIADGPCDSARTLLLRLVDEPLRVTRLAEVLCTHGAPGRPAEASEAAALDSVAGRRGRALEIGSRDRHDGARELHWGPGAQRLVSVVIPTIGGELPLGTCLRSLRERTDYEALEVVLVDSGGGAADVAAPLLGDLRWRAQPYDAVSQFNFSRACNIGAAAAQGELLLFLNDDTEAVEASWIERLAAQATLPGIGAVGPKLEFEGGLVQQAGLALGRLPKWPPAEFVAAQFAYHQRHTSGPHDLLRVVRDCSAVTGACLMVRADLFAELGGWDEGLRIDYGDVDLCLRIRECGERVIVEPRSVLRHAESFTQGYAPHDEDDTRHFLDRWYRDYAGGDPFGHPGLRFDRDWQP